MEVNQIRYIALRIGKKQIFSLKRGVMITAIYGIKIVCIVYVYILFFCGNFDKCVFVFIGILFYFNF